MLELYYPGKDFLMVSVTGQRCDLMCRHCNARFLKHMEPATSPDTLYQLALRAEKEGCRGMLISGGSDRAGKVPIYDYLNIIKKIKNNTNLTLNLHIGFIEADEVGILKNIGIDIVSFDVVGSAIAVKNVFGLDLRPDYFESVLTAFKDVGLNVVPHVTAGLDSGLDSGEQRALEMISGHEPKMVIINSLIPAPGQIVENRLLPVLELANRLLPDTVKIGAGCMRPRDIEISLDLRIDAIAIPSKALRNKLVEAGMDFREKSGCCALASL